MDTFESVYRKYRETVMRFAVRCVGRRDIAEEFTAEAFLELHRHWREIDTNRLPSWLFTVVKNRAADHLRHADLERRYVLRQPCRTASRPSEPFTGLFEHKDLKPVHRICLMLRYVDEMTLEEIACHLGVTEVQVKGRLQYARGLLRKEFVHSAALFAHREKMEDRRVCIMTSS
jgi:RNA polymerase sigma-70 factor (ECF subfamily)